MLVKCLEHMEVRKMKETFPSGEHPESGAILTCAGARMHHVLSVGQWVLMGKGHQPCSAPGGGGGWEEARRWWLGQKCLRGKRQCW